MTRDCRRMRRLLSDEFATARLDDTARRHLDTCADCAALFESLDAVDAALGALPEIDAPDAVVEELVARVALGEADEDKRSKSTAPFGSSRFFLPIFDASRWHIRASLVMVLLAVVSLSLWTYVQPASEPGMNVVYGELRGRSGAGFELGSSYVKVERGKDAETSEEIPQEKLDQLRALGYIGGGPPRKPKSTFHKKDVFPSAPPPQELEEETTDANSTVTTDFPRVVSEAPYIPRDAAELEGEGHRRVHVITKSGPLEYKGTFDLDLDLDYGQEDDGQEAEADEFTFRFDANAASRSPETQEEDANSWLGTDANITFRGGSPRIESPRSESDPTGPFEGDDDARQRVRERLRERLHKLPRGLQEVTTTSGSVASEYGTETGKRSPDWIGLELSVPQFLASREAVDVSFREATGYWANTYVPGDPLMRHLQARLAARDRSQLLPFVDAPFELHDAAYPIAQPFDTPPDSALALYLESDRAVTTGPSRLLLQVGLAGAERYAGRRPAMNVAVVLDLSHEADTEQVRLQRALVAAFVAARQLGDQFRFIVAGPRGGEVLAPEAYWGGPVMVALGEQLAGSGPAYRPVSLPEALRMAIESVAAAGTSNAPLGASAVVLATSRSLEDDELRTLTDLAHRGAVAGITVSAVGLGATADPLQLEALALAGQGQRWLLERPNEASALVSSELAAAARAVARAVRLRIQLAPGVRLVDVIGSRRFGGDEAEKVRQAERSIDQRIALDLGIEADRGDDEAGIQIVIPTFYAGDQHVVLLDVVAPGPGPVAEVTARYKDLVRLDNGVASASFDLPHGDAPRGPLQRNVLKNLLAHRLQTALEKAGRSLIAGDPEAAAQTLAAYRSMLHGLTMVIDGFDKDRDLKRDVALLGEYVQLLRSEAVDDPERREYLAESLRYAARLKVLPKPMAVGAS